MGIKNCKVVSALCLVMVFVSGCAVQSNKQLSQLMKTVEQEASVREIERLQKQYMTIYDELMNREVGSPDMAGIADSLFTVDGAWIVDGGPAYRGKSKIIELFELVYGQYEKNIDHYVKHFSLNPEILIDGDTATKREEFFVLHSDKDKENSFWIVGHYEDVLVKDEAGDWKFLSKTVFVENITGWPSEHLENVPN